MSLSKRRDLGVRIAGDKARLPDEFITRRQIVKGANIDIEYLSNWDIRISAYNGSGGSGGGFGDDDKGPRDLYVELKLVRPFINNRFHYDLRDDDAPSPEFQKYFGTHCFAEIRHNWNLNHRDAFQYSYIDVREQITPSPTNRTNGHPRIIGIDGNKLRIIATDTVGNTRTNPYHWVELDETGSVPKMKNTRLLHFSGTSPDTVGGESQGDHHILTPTFRIRITEVRDYEVARKNSQTGQLSYDNELIP